VAAKEIAGVDSVRTQVIDISEILMENNSHKIWIALCELEDYFSQLGGSAQYLNMSKSEIPLYIACKLAEKYSSSFDLREYISQQFVDAASPVLEKVHSHLKAVNAEHIELANLILDFVNHANSRLNRQDRTFMWIRFTELAIREYAQQGTPNDSPKTGPL
jgi:hypothetical protein